MTRQYRSHRREVHFKVRNIEFYFNFTKFPIYIKKKKFRMYKTKIQNVTIRFPKQPADVKHFNLKCKLSKLITIFHSFSLFNSSINYGTKFCKTDNLTFSIVHRSFPFHFCFHNHFVCHRFDKWNEILEIKSLCTCQSHQ